LLEHVKQLEYEGYEFESAEGSFELIVRQAFAPDQRFFDVRGYEVTMRSEGAEGPRATATVSLHTDAGPLTATATGHGPFNALHTCLCQALASVYPDVGEIELVDYKVRVLDSYKGTAANVRVLIEWRNDHRTFATVGVSDNVIEASWKALVDAVQLELMRAADSTHGAAQPAQAR